MDDEEKLEMLVSYHEWLKKRCKAQARSIATLKHYVKDILLSGMTLELHNANQSCTTATKNDNVVYYVTGYLLARLKRRIRDTCLECVATMEGELDDFSDVGFTPHKFTELKSRGYLKFPTTNMFALI